MSRKFVLDAKNLPCPLPIVKLKKALSEVNLLTNVIELSVTDKAALKDIPAFCSQQGLDCILLKDTPTEKIFAIQLREASEFKGAN